MAIIRKQILIILLILLLPFKFYANKQSDSLHPEAKTPEFFFELSLVEYRLQHYSEAIDYANQALELFRDNGDLDKEGRVLENLGIYYAEFSDYEHSIEYLLMSLKIADQQNNIKAINSRNFNIGTTFVEAGNLSKGIEFLNKAVKYFEGQGPEITPYLIASYTNLGVTYNGLNDLDSAMFFYQKALDLSKKEGVIDQLGGTLLNIGEIHLKNQNIDKALEQYQLALEAFNKVGDNKGTWHTNLSIANIYSKQGKIDESLELLSRTVIHFKETNDLKYLATSYHILSSIYEKQNNFKQALLYKKQLIEVKDSISKSEIINKISNFELQYKIERLQNENKAKLHFIKQEREISTLRWYIATGILVIIIILVITLYNRKKTQSKLVETQLKNTQLEQGRLKIELEYRNKELENFALHIVQKNDFLQDIKSKLKDLRNRASDKNVEDIKELGIKINQSLRINKELEKFRERVDDVNSHFFTTLNENYPELTQKEKRLCALLKLNLSSKEIASLNNISEGAVTMARYRLRKKIGLSNDENLTELFQNLV